jgi:hypothetical protein
MLYVLSSGAKEEDIDLLLYFLSRHIGRCIFIFLTEERTFIQKVFSVSN